MIKRCSVVLATCVIVWTAMPANAVTNGQPDGGEHPYVGELMHFLADVPDPAFDDPGVWMVCTGTLVRPTVVVTAGHCTFGVGLDGESTTSNGDGSGGNDIWIDFSENAHVAGFPASEDYERDENDEAYRDRRDFLNASEFWIRGTAYAHPQFETGPFILHDLGVVVLDEPVTTRGFGEIAPEDYLTEQYAHKPRNDHVFELVGYGLEESRPFFAEGGHSRRKAQIKLNSLTPGAQDAFAFFSNNSGAAHQGGACWGDSGGPILDDTESNLIVAVQSFGLGPRATCSGVAGGYRVDQQDDLDFLAEFGVSPA